MNWYKQAKNDQNKEDKPHSGVLDSQLLCCGYPENRRKEKPYEKKKQPNYPGGKNDEVPSGPKQELKSAKIAMPVMERPSYLNYPDIGHDRYRGTDIAPEVDDSIEIIWWIDMNWQLHQEQAAFDLTHNDLGNMKDTLAKGRYEKKDAGPGRVSLMLTGIAMSKNPKAVQWARNKVIQIIDKAFGNPTIIPFN